MTTTSEPEGAGFGLRVQTTWHQRLVRAAAERYHCEFSLRRRPRVIGGRVTAKFDNEVVLKGKPLDVRTVVHTVTELLTKLNVGSDKYAATLPTDFSPTRRKIERRRWLEQEAANEADRLLSGGG